MVLGSKTRISPPSLLRPRLFPIHLGRCGVHVSRPYAQRSRSMIRVCASLHRQGRVMAPLFPLTAAHLILGVLSWSNPRHHHSINVHQRFMITSSLLLVSMTGPQVAPLAESLNIYAMCPEAIDIKASLFIASMQLKRSLPLFSNLRRRKDASVTSTFTATAEKSIALYRIVNLPWE